MAGVKAWAIGSWGILDGEGPCQVLGRSGLWGRELAQVWIPGQTNTRWVDVSQLQLADGAHPLVRACDIAWQAAAARIRDALARTELIAPLEGLVTPLPHQIQALAKAMAGDQVRFLLADEVGLGKTIEAGLILKELKTRGLVERTLVVAPAGLTSQWVREMDTHFEEDFRLVKPADFNAIRRITGYGEHENVWQMHDQVVVSLDAVKPVDGRRGWSREQLERFNRERFEHLVEADWDLVIIDEAHRVAGSTTQVARHRLGEALAAASPYLLLLSGTPHQGKSEAFQRLMSLLDADVFPAEVPVTRDRVLPYVIRTEKRRAVTSDGKPLFQKRDVRLRPVEWTEEHCEQQALYEAVTLYVRDGYNLAMREKQTAVGFLMVLMQRLVTSSTRAIRWALERRVEHLALPEGQLSLFAEDIASDWDLRDSPEDMEQALSLRLKGLRDERSEVELLVSAARRCEARGPDLKARALLDVMRELEQDASEPEAKFLVFTEFVATQEMLEEFLTERGYAVTTLNGSMSAEERDRSLTAFREEARVLVSTEAGGEGLNLQFCHLVVNFDLPWNPMRLEQRIGRVDRIGQHKVVRAINLALAGTVELRVQAVIEEKLKIILDEFGVDKLEDVLDSEQGDIDFDKLYIDALRDPNQAEAMTEEFLAELRAAVQDAKGGLAIFGEGEDPNPTKAREIEQHALPMWTERMTVEWLRAQAGATAVRDQDTWTLTWPHGATMEGVTFRRSPHGEHQRRLVSLETPAVREILEKLAGLHPLRPMGEIRMDDLPDGVIGTWSVWDISLNPGGKRDRRLLPIFVTDDGRSLGPTARMVWDRLLQDQDARTWTLIPLDPSSQSGAIAEQTREQAVSSGENYFRELLSDYEARSRSESHRLEDTFRLRIAAAQRIAIENIRNARLASLEAARSQAMTEGHVRKNPVPVLEPLLMIRVTAT